MNEKISKNNSSLDYLNARLDQVRMSSYERLRAKASLARTEAFAEAVVEIINLFKRLLKTQPARPSRRPTSSAG